MSVDSKDLSNETRRHISILMLAKITSHKNEIFLDAKLADDNKLVVRFKTSTQNNEMMIKVYEIKNFVKKARVNPFKCEASANNRYSYRLLIKFYTIDQENFLEASLFRTKSIKERIETNKELLKQGLGEQTQGKNSESIVSETLQEKKIFKKISEFKVDGLTFSEVFCGPNDSCLLIDKTSGLVLTTKEDSFLIRNYGEFSKIESIFYLNGSYYLVNSRMKVLEIKFKKFSEYESRQYNVDSLLSSKSIYSHYGHSRKHDIAVYDQTPAIFYFSTNSLSIIQLQQNLDITVQLDLKDKSTTKYGDRFEWSIYHLRKRMILTIFNNTIYLSDPQEGKTLHSFEIPNTVSSQVWEIIRCSEQVYILGILFGKLYHLIKVNTDDKSSLIPIFSFIEVEKNRYATGYKDLSCYQMEGSHKQILFVKFRDEPFYLDTENLMYNDSVFLLNPHNEVNANSESVPRIDGGDQEEKERILLEKIIRAKLASVNYVMDPQKGIEEMKEGLKAVRAEMKSRVNELKRFQIEYRLEMEKRVEVRKDLKEPEGLAKESLIILQEIKIEKKKAQKMKETHKENKKRNYKKERTEKYAMYSST